MKPTIKEEKNIINREIKKNDKKKKSERYGGGERERDMERREK